MPFFRSEKVRKFELCHFFYVGKKLGILDLIILNAEKDVEIGLCHFLCWIKLGKLDFDFFNVGKSSECLTQSFFRPEE